MDAAALRPFSDLTPHAVLDALADAGLHGDGRLLQLNSYENRVVQVSLEDGRVVVAKFYRPGRWTDEQILEEHRFAFDLAAAEIPVVAPLVLQSGSPAITCIGDPPTLAVGATQRFAVTPRCAGRAPELEDPETLEWIGRFIGRLHAVGRQSAFRSRRSVDVDTLGRAPRDWLLREGRLPEDQRERWAAVSQQALDLAQQRFDALPDLRRLRLHGDCHPGNLLWTQQGPHFVDLDDAAMGPAVQDLWMLLSGEPAVARRQLASLLEGYESFCEFDRRELGLTEALRSLRMLHHSAWLAQRWDDPAFPAAFPWFGGGGYWAQQSDDLAAQIVAMGRD